MRRSGPVETGGVSFATLGPVDLVVQVATHAAYSGGHRLMWLADLRGSLAAATESGADPSAILGVADEWGARLALGVMLGRASHEVGALVPPELLRASSPPGWRAIVDVAERAWPPLLAGQGGSGSRLVARACGPTAWRSVRALGTKAVAWQRSGRAVPLDRETLNPDDPRSSLHPVGGPEAAAAFFDQVAGQDPAARRDPSA